MTYIESFKINMLHAVKNTRFLILYFIIYTDFHNTLIINVFLI